MCAVFFRRVLATSYLLFWLILKIYSFPGWSLDEGRKPVEEEAKLPGSAIHSEKLLGSHS